MINLYIVKDEYIDYLKKYDSRILDNEKNSDKRKYFGFILELNNIKYIVPISSAKLNKDYIIIGYNDQGEECHKLLQPQFSRPIIRIIDKRKDGSIRVLSKILISNMIPIGNDIDKYVTLYNYQSEKDLKYKDLIMMEIKFINKNIKNIKRNADALYKLRIADRLDIGFIKNAALDFILLEDKCHQYLK